MNRKLLAVIVLATCAATTAITTATEIEGPAVRWNVLLWGQKRTFTAGFESLAELVRARTGGSFIMTLHYGGALSKSRENLDGIAVGAFEAAMICNFYHPLKDPALMVLTMPFLPMSNWEDNRKVRDAVHAHPATIREFTQWNAMLYMSSYLPQYELMGKDDPPSRLEDCMGSGRQVSLTVDPYIGSTLATKHSSTHHARHEARYVYLPRLTTPARRQPGNV